MKKAILIFTGAIMLYMAVSPLRGGYIQIAGLKGFPLAAVAGGIGFFIFTVWALRYSRNSLKWYYAALAAGLGGSLIDVIGFFFSVYWLVYPELALRLLAIGAACVWSRIKNKAVKYLVPAGLFSIFLLTAYFIMPLGIHRSNYGTFTGLVNEVWEDFPEFKSEAGCNIDRRNFQGRYNVLYFWNTRCSYCYKHFPVLMKWIRETGNDSGLNIGTVHVRDERQGEDYASGHQILERENADLPVISIELRDSSLRALGVRVYPTVLVLGPDGRIVYRGELNIRRIKNITGR